MSAQQRMEKDLLRNAIRDRLNDAVDKLLNLNQDRDYYNTYKYVICCRIVNIMLEKGAVNYNQCMFEACISGHIDIVNRMLELGVDNYRNSLERACTLGHIEIVLRMLHSGADPTDQTIYESDTIANKLLLFAIDYKSMLNIKILLKCLKRYDMFIPKEIYRLSKGFM